MCFFGRKRKARKKAEKLAKIEAEQNAEKEEVETSKPVATNTSEAKPKASKEEKEKDTIPKYHVAQNNDDKSPNFKEWRVRRSGSRKTIKHFKTQVEAIEYAEHLAEQAGSSIVIHKMDGKIRKQDYTKKE